MPIVCGTLHMCSFRLSAGHTLNGLQWPSSLRNRDQQSSINVIQGLGITHSSHASRLLSNPVVSVASICLDRDRGQVLTMMPNDPYGPRVPSKR